MSAEDFIGKLHSGRVTDAVHRVRDVVLARHSAPWSVAEVEAARLPRDLLIALAAHWMIGEARDDIRVRALEAELDDERRRAAQERSNEQHRRWKKAHPEEAAAEAERIREWEDRRQQERDERLRAAERRVVATFERTALEFARLKLMEFGPDLLATFFKLPDGTLVTWGEATVAEHRAVIDQRLSFVIANVKGAARHQEAVDVLTETGARCLNDIDPPIRKDTE